MTRPWSESASGPMNATLNPEASTGASRVLTAHDEQLGRGKNVRKELWPEGETVAVNCPNCAVLLDVQIAVVREDGMPFRPADCDVCGAEFDLLADGTTDLTFAPPQRSAES